MRATIIIERRSRRRNRYTLKIGNATVAFDRSMARVLATLRSAIADFKSRGIALAGVDIQDNR